MFNTVSLSEQVQKALKEEILTGPLAPGQRIDLRAYAKLWNVSPTPLRDGAFGARTGRVRTAGSGSEDGANG
jgi:Bacterial regulatory proteins, gntR family